MCQAKLAFVEQDLIADEGANYKLRAVGPWQVLFGGSSFDTCATLTNLESPLGVKVGWRVAPVRTENPDAWETLGTARTTAGDSMNPESFNCSAKTSALFIQAALFTALTSGAVPKTVHARLWSTVNGAGWLVARQKLVLTATSANQVIPIGQPFNCAGVTGLMFGFIFSGISGTIDNPTCGWRSFASGDVHRPSAWASLSTLSDVTTDTAVNSGTLAVTTTGKLMAQAGFKYATTGTDQGGTVEIIVAAKQ